MLNPFLANYIHIALPIPSVLPVTTTQDFYPYLYGRLYPFLIKSYINLINKKPFLIVISNPITANNLNARG